jgi:ABC-type bacteriocin/lantibiotic exporter with double-glycine peptidase domain
VAGGAAGVSGCAGAAARQAGGAPVHVISNVPFYPQKKDQCGPASLAGVLGFRGVAVSPDEIAAEIYSPTAGGSLDSDLLRYAVKKGLRAERYRGGPEDLKAQIGRGNPLIVLVDYGFLSYRAHHFMVITGYDDHGVIANSGTDRSKYIPMGDFLKSWEKTGLWTLLIVPEGGETGGRK